MAHISSTETNHNIIFYYSLDNYTAGDAFDWLIAVSQNEAIHVIRIQCDSILDRNDEGNTSFTLGRITSKEKIANLCHAKGIDIVSIIGTYEHNPIIVGVDLRTKSPFITIRKSKMADYKKLEREIFLIKPHLESPQL